MTKRKIGFNADQQAPVTRTRKPKPQITAIPNTRSISYETGLANGLCLEPTASGVSLSSEKLLSLSSFYCGVRHIVDTISCLPIQIMQHQADGGRLNLPDHPLAWLLNHEPNQYQSAQVFWEFMILQLLVYGNAFAKIERNNAGEALALHPLVADFVQGLWDVDSKTISYQINRSVYTQQELLSADEVFHLPAMSLNGLFGMQPITYARNNLAGSVALEQFSQSFWANSTRPSGLLKSATVLSDKAKQNLKESWGKSYSGSGTTGSTPLLEEGVTWEKVSIDPDEAQYLGSKQNAVLDNSRWLKISPTKLSSLERATWANIEAENISFARSTIAPITRKIESEGNRKLLLPSEKGKVVLEYVLDGILKGDSKTISANNASALGGVGQPWRTVNEVRLDMGYPPIEGGDVLAKPLNIGNADPSAPQPDAEPNDPQPSKETFTPEEDAD